MKTMHLLPPAFLVSVLLGCASPRIIPMTEGAASKIKSTEAILVLSQQEIAAEINPSAVAAAGGGGLLLALVDVAVNKSRADDAEAAIAPIKNALLDYDFAKQLRVALEEELRRLAWINLQSLRTVSSQDTKKIDGEVAASAATAVLVMPITLGCALYAEVGIRIFSKQSFGPAETDNIAISARIRSAAKGRRYPSFGVGLNGVAGYKLQVSPAKKMLELYKDQELKQTLPYDWKSGQWTQLRLQVRKIKESEWKIEGKVWIEGNPEPKEWMIAANETEAPASGRASVFGSPFSGTPIQFDDFVVSGVP